MIPSYGWYHHIGWCHHKGIICEAMSNELTIKQSFWSTSICEAMSNDLTIKKSFWSTSLYYNTYFFFWLVLILIQSCHTLYTQLAIETILFWYLSLLYLFGGTVHVKMIKVLIWQNRWKDFLQNWWIYCFIKWFIKWCDFVRRQQQKRWNQSFFLESFFWRKL